MGCTLGMIAGGSSSVERQVAQAPIVPLLHPSSKHSPTASSMLSRNPFRLSSTRNMNSVRSNPSGATVAGAAVAGAAVAGGKVAGAGFSGDESSVSEEVDDDEDDDEEDDDDDDDDEDDSELLPLLDSVVCARSRSAMPNRQNQNTLIDMV